MRWVISNDHEEPLYWSNQWGWTGLEDCDVFTEDERGEFNLPTDGRWVPAKLDVCR